MNRRLRLNWYLVPFFGVHRMCVPYGMWGLKTQQVKQSDRTIVNLTRSAREGKNLFSRSRSQWKICSVGGRQFTFPPPRTRTRSNVSKTPGVSVAQKRRCPVCISDIFLTWQQSFLPQLLCFRETMLCNQCCGNGDVHTLRFREHDMG